MAIFAAGHARLAAGRDGRSLAEEPGGVQTIDELANWLRELGSMLYKPALESRISYQEIGRQWRSESGPSFAGWGTMDPRAREPDET